MARLFGLGAVLLGAAAWPALTQEAPPQRTVRLRPAAMPSPSPTPVRIPSGDRIRRSPAAETPAPRERHLRGQETPEPREARPVRERRIPAEAAPRGGRDPFDSGEADTPQETAPVRDRRRMPVEATPPPRDTTPVRMRRVPVEADPETEPAETRPVRSRRIPVEATPPPREPGPVRVRRTPVEETYEPSEPTPVRTRRTPVESYEPSDPTPVRVRRTPVETMPDEPTPVRVRRVPYADMPVEVPERIRRVPVEETPVPRRRPVWAQPDPVAQQFDDAPIQAGRCGIRTGSQPLMARLGPNAAQDASLAIITPPSEVAVAALPGSVTLRPGSHADIMRTLPVLRRIPSATVRGNAILTIGKTRFDFRPMVQNPKALLNIAQNLRGIPDQVDVCADILEAMEIKQGLVVRSLLTYSIRPGGCRDVARRARLARTGVNCFTRESSAERDAAFRNPGDPRFVADPVKRAQAIAASRAQAAKMAADIDRSVADFRNQLNDPGQRAQMVAEAGEGEVARLEGLNDSDLAGELANASETKVEQVAFIPNLDTLGKIIKPMSLPAASPEPEPPVDIDYDIGRYVFLTGFTLGKEYQWKQRVETTIKWCFVGCKRTYYAELFAGFSYSFGLRFPIELGGTYNPKPDAQGKATLKVRLKPIDGSVADYKATGLPDSKLFNGRELVAEVSAYAGASAKLPVVGVLGPVELPVGMDFTGQLPAPLTNGQFTPPTPGVPGSEPEFVKVFDDFDLLGGRANFGVLGGKLLPAVKVKLHSEKMSLKLTDTTGGGEPVSLSHDGQEVKLAINPQGKSSTFTVSDPVYNLGFNVTPGLTARLFIDLAVWGNHWDWPIWFPQLAVDLPPGGVDFACHSGTICSHDLRFNPKGSQSAFEGEVEKWGFDYAALWEPKCHDEICRFGIRLIRQGTVLNGSERYAADHNITMKQFNPVLVEAYRIAQRLIADSLARKAEAASNSWGILAQGIYAKQCSDSLCFDNVQALAQEMGPRAKQIAQANGGQSPLWVSQQANKEYAPRFSAEITASKQRAAMRQSILIQKQIGKQPKPH